MGCPIELCKTEIDSAKLQYTYGVFCNFVIALYPIGTLTLSHRLCEYVLVVLDLLLQPLHLSRPLAIVAAADVGRLGIVGL